MRRLLLALSAVALIAGMAPAAAEPEPGPGYIATDNVEWVANLPLNTDSAGAKVLGKSLFVTDDRGLTIWDISKPASPSLVSFTAAPQGAYYVEEDVDTNGKILLIGSYSDLTQRLPGPLDRLFVLDVSNRAAPKIIGELQGANSHTVSCVLDCTYAYNSDGRIIDLRNPAQPKLTGTRWDTGMTVRSRHDVTEVAPGIVLTSTNPMLYLDARQDPANPKLLGTASPGDNRLMHGNLWPRGGTDKFMLAGGETGGDCASETDGAFMTYTHSTDPVTGKTSFDKADEFRLFTGLPTDGNSPYDQFCAHWFTEHPTFNDGGLVAMGWYEHGTRFLDVDRETGEITEKGWFYPVGGSTSAAYWINDEYLYVIDYQRGIDILRWTGKPATKTVKVGDQTPPARPKLPARPRPLKALASDANYICPLPGV